MHRLLVLCAMLMALVAVPAFAYQPGEQIPTENMPHVNPTYSGRSELVSTINGEPYLVGHAAYESPDRMYMVLKTLAFEDMPEETVEMVLYGSRIYIRENDDPQWYYIDFDSPFTAQSSHDFWTYIGQISVAGQATDQFQYWEGLDEANYVKVDVFLGVADSMVHQLVLSSGFSIEGLGTLELASIERFYAFNEAITVYEPQNAIELPDEPSSPLPLTLSAQSSPKQVVLRMITQNIIGR